MTTTMTAAEHAKQTNDKTRAWLAANPGGWAGLISEDQSYYEARGIHTADDLDRNMAIETHADIYKETYGIRPRRNWDGVATADIWAAVEDL